MAVRGHGLGRIPLFDERSRNCPAKVAGLTEVRTRYWRVYGPRLDQGNLGSCTGNSMATSLNCKPLHHARAAYKVEEDALKVYSRATQIDPFPGVYPPTDTGSSVLSAAKATVEFGWASGYTWAFGFQHLTEALQAGPVAVGVNWYESFFDPTATGYIDLHGPVVGGHAFCINGINLRDRYVWAVNSWGPSWGLSGRFKIPFAIMSRLLDEDGECAVLAP